jgi:isopentenyldiphosphate isomerase
LLNRRAVDGYSFDLGDEGSGLNNNEDVTNAPSGLPIVNSELLDIFDDAGRIAGQTTRREAHTAGHIHRSVLFFLLDENHRVFVNQRTAGKEFYPEYWSVVFGGHVPAGETYEQAVRREAEEEAGINGEPQYFGSFQKRFDAFDKEDVQVFAFITNQAPRLDPGEIQGGEFVEIDQLGTWLATHPFLPETAVVIPLLLGHLERPLA